MYAGNLENSNYQLHRWKCPPSVTSWHVSLCQERDGILGVDQSSSVGYLCGQEVLSGIVLLSTEDTLNKTSSTCRHYPMHT